MEVLTIILIVLFCIDIAISAVNGVLDGKHESELNYRLRRIERLLDREMCESVFPEYSAGYKAARLCDYCKYCNKSDKVCGLDGEPLENIDCTDCVSYAAKGDDNENL